MGENQRKCCKLRFKNTTEQISIELLYTKRDRDVDIRDFFGNILKQINTLQVRFKKDHYELTDSKQEDVLKIVPKVIENFQEFYKGSFGEIASDDEYVDTRTRKKEPLTMEQKIEVQTTSKMYPGYSSHDSSLGNSELQKEEEKQRENKQKSSVLQKTHFDGDESPTVLQNADDGSVAQAHKSHTVKTDTSERSDRQKHQEETDNNSRYVSKSDEKYNKLQAEKHDSKGGKKTKKEGEDEEQDLREEGEDQNCSKGLRGELSCSDIALEMHDEEPDASQKEKSVFFDQEKHKDNEDGEEKKKMKASKNGDVVNNISVGESNEEKTKAHDGSKEHELNLSVTGNTEHEDDAETVRKKEEKKKTNASKDGDVGKNSSVGESDEDKPKSKVMTDHKN